MRSTFPARYWLVLTVAFLFLGLTWLASPRQVFSQDERPEFFKTECPETQDGYVETIKPGHTGFPGGINCQYYKQDPDDSSLKNWRSLYISYYRSPEEAVETLSNDFLDDEHLKFFACETWNDCDRIDRRLIERTENSMYGYSITLSPDPDKYPDNYSLERRYTSGPYIVTIFVQGELFSTIEEAMSEVAKLETVSKALIDKPREMVTPKPLTTGEATEETSEPGVTSTDEASLDGTKIDEDKVGMPCDEYCLSLEPIGFWLDGDTYPDCKCDCGLGNIYLGLKCLSCSEMCTGEGQRLYTQKDQPCTCLCTDPKKKYDPGSRECIELDGSECNRSNGCEPELGENCLNCPDCGCSFGSAANQQYNQWLTCNPASPKADIFGCVFDMPESEQLAIMGTEWDQCRDAWALMNHSASSGAVGYKGEIMNAMTALAQVQVWQKKSGCIPEDGVVLWREAADPMVCLMRYCDRIKTGVHELEIKVEGQTPVIYGPAIKIKPPDAKVSITPAQTIQFEDRVSIYGVRSTSLESPLGAGFAHSVYEIDYDPESGMMIYLFEGAYTHTYYDTAEDVAKQVPLGAGQVLVVNLEGVPISRTAFDPASRDPWWESVDYLVTCPDNATQAGPDCFCDPGFEVDIGLERCIVVENTGISKQTRLWIISTIVFIAIIVVLALLITGVVIMARRRQRTAP